jgi:hypothetical protein
VLEKLRNNNLIKVIMKALLIDGGLPQNHIAHKLICFGVNVTNVIQGTRNIVTKKIHDIYVPNSLRIHCTMYAPLHQFGFAKLIRFTFGHPP